LVIFPLIPPANESVSFLYAVFNIQIDIQSTFDEKLDYVVHFLWNNTSGEWSKAVSEQSFDGRPRVLNVEGNYTILGRIGYLALSADLIKYLKTMANMLSWKQSITA
jgi:hypothetical protein